jgi:hypothetical protein
MAGVYGEINSKSDYQRVLREASSIVIRVLEGTPNDGTMQGVRKQLEAMKRWTDGGRKPSEIERRNIDIGLVAARELSDATGELSDLAQKLCALNNYFEDWPTDAEAASATDDDFFDEDD